MCSLNLHLVWSKHASPGFSKCHSELQFIISSKKDSIAGKKFNNPLLCIVIKIEPECLGEIPGICFIACFLWNVDLSSDLKYQWTRWDQPPEKRSWVGFPHNNSFIHWLSSNNFHQNSINHEAEIEKLWVAKSNTLHV